MVILLCRRHDLAVEALSAAASLRGIRCLTVHDWGTVRLSIVSTREGAVTLSVRAGPDGAPVSAIYNRMTSSGPLAESDEQFWAAETMAAWWSALAWFAGPVINRPSRTGYLPHLDPSSLAAAVPGLLTSQMPLRLGAGNAARRRTTILAQGGANILLGGANLLPGTDQGTMGGDTPADADSRVLLLVAGTQVFDLAAPTGAVQPGIRDRLSPLLSELRRRSAAFCSLQVVAGSQLRLLETNPIPIWEEYAHLEGAVHQAVLEYLVQ